MIIQDLGSYICSIVLWVTIASCMTGFSKVIQLTYILASYLSLLTKAFVTCSTNMKQSLEKLVICIAIFEC